MTTTGNRANGISVFSTFQVIESTGIGARFDWIKVELTRRRRPANSGSWAITATVAHNITDGLTGKVEYRRYDIAAVGSFLGLPDNGAHSEHGSMFR